MKISLNDREWREFFVKDIFPITQRGKRLTKEKQISGNKPYVSSTALNNGVDNFIANSSNVRMFTNCLTIANSGSVGSCFFHPYEFVASDHVTHLKNDQFNEYVYLFIASIANRFSQKYNFNREINDTRISKEKLILPIDVNGLPDWQFIEQYIKEILEKKQAEFVQFAKKFLVELEYKNIDLLKDKKWKPFKIEELFIVDKGVYLPKKNIIPGKNPYITASSNNNGVSDFIDNKTLFSKNTITVEKIYLSAFYQPYDYYCSHDVSVLKNDSLNKFTSLFISTMIKRQGVKYSYGRQAQLNVVKRETIYLPITDDDLPDWLFMEQYIKNAYHIKLTQYLKYLETTKVVPLNPNTPPNLQ